MILQHEMKLKLIHDRQLYLQHNTAKSLLIPPTHEESGFYLCNDKHLTYNNCVVPYLSLQHIFLLTKSCLKCPGEVMQSECLLSNTCWYIGFLFLENTLSIGTTVIASQEYLLNFFCHHHCTNLISE